MGFEVGGRAGHGRQQKHDEPDDGEDAWSGVGVGVGVGLGLGLGLVTVKLPVTTMRLIDLSVCTSHERKKVRKFMTRTCAHRQHNRALGIGHWALGIGNWALGMHWALGIGHYEDLCAQVDEADEHDAAQDDRPVPAHGPLQPLVHALRQPEGTLLVDHERAAHVHAHELVECREEEHLQP